MNASLRQNPPLAVSEIDPVDLYVGARIRFRRKQIGLSQDSLAIALGLTFQQVQKYEKGTNRISASKLHAAADALDTNVAWFFEGLPSKDAPDAGFALPISAEADQLGRLFDTLPHRQKDLVARLIETMVPAEAAGG